MEHVFEGTPDERQAEEIVPSRFRPRYRTLTEGEKLLHDNIKQRAVELEELFNLVKEGRYRFLGMTALEEAVMWTIKELTS